MDENLSWDVIYLKGELTNAEGMVVPDGMYAASLNIFPEPTEGKAIWSQWIESVMVYKGRFLIPVEKKSLPLDDLQKGELYLEIQVGKEPARSRQKIDVNDFTDKWFTAYGVPVLEAKSAFSFAGVAPDVYLPIQPGLQAPSLEASLFLGTGDDAPWGIDASDGYVYVSTLNQNFHVIDARDPGSPAIVGTLLLPLPRGAAALQVVKSGSYAFLLYSYSIPSNDDQSVARQSGLMVVDVSQPARPLQVSDWRVDTLLHKLAVSTEYAVVSQFDGKLHFFLLEKGYYPVHTGELMLGQGFPDVALQNSYLYAATGRFEASYFYVIDVGSAKPIVGTLTLPPTALRTRVAGNYAYVAGRRNLGFTIDISDPAQPRLVGDWPVIGIPSSMWMIGNTLYLIDEASDIIQVLDIGNPLQPIVYDWTLTQGGGHTYGAVSDGFAYIVSAAAGFLRIFRLPRSST